MTCLFVCLLHDWYTPRVTKCFLFTRWRYKCRRSRGCLQDPRLRNCLANPYCLQPHSAPSGTVLSLTMQEHRRHSRSALPRGFYPDILGSPSFLGSLSDCSRGPVRLGLQRASPTPRRTFCRRSGLGITPGPSTTCSRYTAPPPINVTRDYRCCQTTQLG